MVRMELIARALVTDDGRVLLARLVDAPWWFLPGGHVERGERAEAALRRELAEELGVHSVEVGDVLAVIENRYADAGGTHHELNLVFGVRLGGHEVRSAEPHLEVRPVAARAVLAGELDGPGLRVLSDGFGESGTLDR
jgi:8-oxo-dGTP diphosphatase